MYEKKPLACEVPTASFLQKIMDRAGLLHSTLFVEMCTFYTILAKGNVNT